MMDCQVSGNNSLSSYEPCHHYQTEFLEGYGGNLEDLDREENLVTVQAGPATEAILETKGHLEMTV